MSTSRRHVTPLRWAAGGHKAGPGDVLPQARRPVRNTTQDSTAVLYPRTRGQLPRHTGRSFPGGAAVGKTGGRPAGVDSGASPAAADKEEPPPCRTRAQAGAPTEGYDMAKSYRIVRGHMEHLAAFHLSSDELRGIAEALGSHDAGAQEMLRAADEIDAADAAEQVSA